MVSPQRSSRDVNTEPLTPCLRSVEFTGGKGAIRVDDVEALRLGSGLIPQLMQGFACCLGHRARQPAYAFDPRVEGGDQIRVRTGIEMRQPFANTNGYQTFGCTAFESIRTGALPRHRERVGRSTDDDQVERLGDGVRRATDLTQLDRQVAAESRAALYVTLKRKDWL